MEEIKGEAMPDNNISTYIYTDDGAKWGFFFQYGRVWKSEGGRSRVCHALAKDAEPLSALAFDL